MNVDYAGHDRQYIHRKEVGLSGWNTEQVAQENIARLQLDLDKPHIPQSGDLLEVGCGAGDLSLWLAGKGYRVHGIDISPTAIEWARNKALKQAIKAEFVVGDVRTLDAYTDDSFDMVLDGYCLHCLIGNNDRGMFLNNVHRILRPGGLFLVNTMCSDPIAPAIRANFEPVSRCVVQGNVATRYLGTPEAITSELAGAGFTLMYARVDKAGDSQSQDVFRVDACKLEIMAGT